MVVFTGAGVSRESGIATFRDPGEGLWAQYDPMELATREAFERDPAFVWSWHRERFGKLREAQPNPGHVALAELERHVPSVIVVTQNIDGLHQRAGSSDVIELHGSANRYKCLGERHTGFTWDDIWGSDEAPPRCPECGDLMRPDVVWFGESLPHEAITRAFDAARRCDVMLVVGTSGVVQPAASVPLVALQSGAFLIDVNPVPDELTNIVHAFLQGRGGEVVPLLVRAVAEGFADSSAG